MDVDLLDEELRARAIQGAANPLFESLVKPETPAGLSPISSIGPALPKFSPTLQTPKHILIDVIAAHHETERLTSKYAKLFDDDVTTCQAEINHLSAEKEEAFQKEAEAAKARATWSTLSTVAHYIAGVGAVTMGAALWSLASIPAVMWIAAGILGIGVQIARDTHFLPIAIAWFTKSVELQKTITHQIEMGAFFLQMGLGLAGGVWAWQTGAMAAAQISQAAIHQQAKSIITGAAGVISVGGQIGAKHYDKKIAHLTADMRDIDTKTTLAHQALYHTSSQMGKMIEAVQSQTNELKKAIQALEVPQD